MSYTFAPQVGDTVGLKTKSKKVLEGFNFHDKTVRQIKNVAGSNLYEVFGLLLEKKDIRPVLTKKESVDALDWILDCCTNESDAEIARDLSVDEIEDYVEKNFENGIEGFKNSYYL